MLPAIPAGVCGNRVIEPGESCDGFGRGEASCRPPGTIGQCALDCTARGDGTRPECPSSYGCDETGVCRRATGGYRPVAEPLSGTAFSVAVHDFDGDRRADVLSQEAAGPLGATKFRVHYFDRDGALDSTWIWPRSIAALATASVSADERADIVFTDGRVGVLLGQADRTLISETYPTYVLANTRVRIAGALYFKDISNTTPLLAISEAGGELLVTRPDETTATLKTLAALPGDIDDLAGDPVIGDLFAAALDDPCLDTVIALRGATEAFVYSVCRTSPVTGDAGWADVARVTAVSLAPAATIDGGPRLGDIDGDGHLDLLLRAEGQLFVAFGDGHGLTPARPWRARIDGRSSPVPFPLAAGDFTGDGAADLVFSSNFMLSQRAAARDDFGYRNADARFGAMWSEARVVDLNGNGKLDVIASSNTKLDIDFFNGTGSEFLNPFVIPTGRPVEHLAVGDIDGDLIDDLAFVQLGAADEANEVLVAFGDTAGPPGAPVAAVRVRDVMQIGALTNAGADAGAELFLAYTQAGAQGQRDAAFAWLTGFDRSLMCQVELTTFASDGSIQSAPALRLMLGAFETPGQQDAVLLSSALMNHDVALWWMPDLRGGTGRPELLGWGLDPRFEPLRGLDTVAEIELLMAAGDLDGDDIDELVLAAPDSNGEHCFLVTARLGRHHGIELQSSPAVQVEPACASVGQLAIEDLDGDAAADLVLLTGRPGEARSLVALWNDGRGGFSADATLTLAGPDDTPQAFALYRPTPRDRLRLAYVTETQLRIARATRHARGFEDVAGALELELRHATGIAAGDVDGDGVADLVLADSGSVRLLRAELEP